MVSTKCKKRYAARSLVVSCVEYVEQSKKQVDDVQIKGDCCHDVLVVAETLDQVVSVIYDVTTENDRSQATIYSQ